jgi:pimeloyl-ACP methyl ester carboxylesterase
LVIGGDHDVIPVLHTVLITSNIPQSYLWIIPNSGHSTPVFKKEQFNPLIYDFFTKPYRKIEGAATYQ